MKAKKSRENGLDKTLADSFPSSDPLSTIPDPLSSGPGDDAPDENAEGRKAAADES
jgi:hypothetical protein